MPLEWDLPYDVENLIFDAIHNTEPHLRESYYDNQHPRKSSRAPDATAALVACSCVCKAWRKYALERLFKVVKIRAKHTDASGLLQLKGRWHVHFKIETLDLPSRREVNWTKEAFADISTELKDLQSVLVRNSLQLALLDGSVPNLRFLDLTITQPLRRLEFIQMLLGVPRLKVLHLESQRTGYIYKGDGDDAEGERIPRLSIKLEEFCIFHHAQQEAKCWLWLLESSRESLHTVTMRHTKHLAWPFIAAFQCVGKSIRHLTLTHATTDPVVLGLAEDLLPFCPNLTHATCYLMWFQDCYEAVLSVIPTTLTSIRLCEKWSKSDPYLPLADIFLDGVAAGRLPQLQELILDIWNDGYTRFDTLDFLEDREQSIRNWKKDLEKSLGGVGIKCRLVLFEGKAVRIIDR